MCVFPKEKPYFSQNHHVAKNLILGSFLEPFWYHFSMILVSFFDLFSTSIFTWVFYRFFVIFGPKMGPKNSTCGHTFSIIKSTFSENRFLDAFWSLFGALLAPCWSLLAPFWLTFGVLGLTFGAFRFTFGDPGAQCSHFWCLLASFFIFLCIFDEILCKIAFFENCYSKFL